MRFKRSTVFACSLALLVGGASSSSAYLRPGVTDHVSVSSEGKQGEAPAIDAIVRSCPSRCLTDISANGRYVAFESGAVGLVDDDRNEVGDIFVRDRVKASTQRVSIASDGTEGVGICTPDPQDAKDWSPGSELPLGATMGSHRASISASGQSVVFGSCASNLVPLDHKHTQDVFVHDRGPGRTELVSQSSKGEPAFCINGNGCSRITTPQSVSADGRYVVFESNAANLVPGDTNEMSDVFVRDRTKRETYRVSVTSEGDEATRPTWVNAAGSLYGAISDNGRYVAFVSDSPNLGPGVNDNIWTDYLDVFVHDRNTGKTEQVDLVSGDGLPAQDDFTTGLSSEGLWKFDIALSPDGRYVAYTSRWGGFVPNDSNDGYDIFFYDRQTRRTQRVSVTSTGGEGNAWSLGHLAISKGGRFVSFTSASALVADDQDGGCGAQSSPMDSPCNVIAAENQDVYIYDLDTGAAELLSRHYDGSTTCDEDEDGCKFWNISGGMNANGRYVAFQSSDRLVEDMQPGHQEFFVRDRGEVMGVGGFGSGPPDSADPGPEPLVCIESVCIPPGAAMYSSDSTSDLDDVLTRQGANLYGASLAYRPQFDDLFARIELEYMPSLGVSLGPVSSLDSPTMFYGLRFEADGRSYEVRATGLLGGTFELFDCTSPSPTCAKVGDLPGGYGTTGMEVVFALPLDAIGIDERGSLRDVEAFSAIGTSVAGATKVFDRLNISEVR